MVAVIVVLAALISVGGLVAAARALCLGCGSEADITVVAPAGTVQESDIAITGEAAELIRAAAEANGRLNLVKVDGDGSTEVEPYDLTPRDGKGRELKPRQRRLDSTDAMIADLAAAMNNFDSTVDGRSVLAGLQNVPAGGTGPVLVFSSGLDTKDPLSYISLGFDVAPKAVVEQLKAAKELPTNLKGRDVTFVLTPTAGQQQAPRQPQVLYRQQLLTAISRAAGARTVKFLVGQGGLPAGSGGNAPVVPMPAPPGTSKGGTTTSTDKNGTTTVTTQCVIPSPLLFEPDSSTLLDTKAAKTALANCIRHTTAATRVRVDGHTACRNAPDSDPAVARQLSEARARRIVDLAIELGVRSRNTTTHGWGDTKPLTKPCSDPANRATVVTITAPKEAHK